MNTPLYYDDAYLTEFTAVICKCIAENGRFGIILDNTAFYPTSGGQPHDTGKLNSEAVIDVTYADGNQEIVHWVQRPLEVGTAVEGKINWSRRFDHMQQHTGQHMLSQAFIQEANAPTLSFHLGPKTVTIDLDIDQLSVEQLKTVETFVNQIVWENRPITIEYTSPQEAKVLNVRKLPESNRQKVRLVHIKDFDLTACGGTHVSYTGSVGIIKIIKTERQNKKIRVTFACGQRALSDYDNRNQITNALMQQLTTGLDSLVGNISQLQSANKQLQKEVTQLQTEQMVYHASDIAQKAKKIDQFDCIIHIAESLSPASLRTLGQALLENESTIVMLANIVDGKTHLLFGCSDGVPVDMSRLLKDVTQRLGDGSGGGRPNMAQGGTIIDDATRLVETFREALTAVLQK